MATTATVVQLVGLVAILVGLAWLLGPWVLIGSGAAAMVLPELVRREEVARR